MNFADTLRAAAQALSNRPDLAHAPAQAGLLQNRANDMEDNIVVWKCAGQHVSDLVEKHYGVYLAVARAILFDPRYGIDRSAAFPQTS